MKHTPHTVVLPFYGYAAIALLAATILLACSTGAMTGHYFQPHVLAITHAMALGWGTMIILGASHQLIPVLIEGRLYSNTLAMLCFVLAAMGIPLLVYGFYVFDLGWPAKAGGILINVAVSLYVVNVVLSVQKSGKESIQAVFVLTAACWLLLTTGVGLLLLYNFTDPFLSRDSLAFLSLHMHLGVIGWFLLLVAGVGSRLVPMFLLSKYSNTSQLWWMYALINGGLLLFVFLFVRFPESGWHKIAILPLAMALLIFGVYCFRVYQSRIRKRVDGQMRLSILSILMAFLPLFIIAVISIGSAVVGNSPVLPLVYGFAIFFGWLTSIILGMTFKTLPFIVWSKVYEHQAGLKKTPQPADLFSHRLFRLMALTYLAGFLLFATGLAWKNIIVLNFSAPLLVTAAFCYNLNVFKLVFHGRHHQ
ncbi:hypothetical protein [Flavihumibacter petaseus]|uniref:Cytochrome C oxidase subunit I n=1 Tax=Flavihumibacter petaseus NBRC 106054 TaxID=1220578 RepID=A0A0E9MY81_9BACT|nr:hypothetical protein [Flavihumibacter petaseus]GAO42692.1 hypothetical protein FPE01S_01_17080 [Flavihumibacter petaseus NBRC 106054]